MKLRAVALLLLVFAFSDAGHQSAAPETLYQRTRLAIWQGDFEPAIALARRGLLAFGARPEWQELFAIAEAEALARSKPLNALALLDRTPRSGNAEATVRRPIAHGYALFCHGEYEKADADYARADALAARLRPTLRAEIAMHRASPATKLGDFDAAERYAREAATKSRAMRQPFVLANSLVMIALAEMNRRQFEQSLADSEVAAHVARSVGAKRTLSVLTGNVGWCYMQLGDAEEAKARYMAAQQDAEKNNVLRVQPTWLTNIANVYVAQQQFPDAMPWAERSLAAARRLGDQSKIASSLSNLGQVNIEMGRYEIARRLNDESLTLRRANGEEREIRYSLLNQARIAGATGAPRDGLAILDSVIRSADDDAPLRWAAQAAAAAMYRRLGDIPNAERMYEAALDTGDAARVKASSEDAYRFAFEANLIRFYDDYIDLLLDSGRPVDALRVAERSRARTLREGIGLIPRGAAAERSFAPTVVARKANAVILSYWLAPRRSLLWIVSPQTVSVATLPASSAIEREINSYREELLAGRRSPESARGARLYDMLIAPAMQVTRSRRVIVIPDGPLNWINLETLIVPSPRPHYWIEDVTISYAPSLHLLDAPARARGARDGWILVIGNVPAAGSEFPALSRAGAEMNGVERHFDRQRRVVIDGLRATPSSYLASNPRRFDYLHFVAHGTANTRAPLDSAVILASDANGFRLTGRDIVRTPLDAQLVTVSSCDSAGRRSYAGEGLVGLAWAFLRAGARRVVAAQWEVSDTATPILMDRMYAGLAAGRDPATALRDAKLTLLHSDSIYSRPLYWAPFVVYGAA